MTAKPFYITTPIYYVNDEPHIGHAYTTVLGDTLARYHRQFGEDVYYLTGNDEHGLKVQQAADKRGVAPQTHCDEMSERFKELWVRLNISHNDFIRTTEERHKRVVREFLQRAYDNGDIYKASYKGWYSVREEMFVTDKEVEELKDDIDAGRVIELEEENYFFRLSKYQEWLVHYIKDNPEFIAPEARRNEVLGFLREPLNDLCVSRPASRLKWGVPLPFDDNFVTYVWFDALINYVSAIGWHTDDSSQFDRLWPTALHLIGKDIIKPHCVYWPIMLHAIGLAPPRQVLAHGWWVDPDGNKLSKTLHGSGLFLWLADQYGVDEFRYFLMRNMVVGRDGGVSEQAFVDRCNSDLANDLGNLLSRTVKMVFQYCDSKVPEARSIDETDRTLEQMAEATAAKVREWIEKIEPHNAIEETLKLVRATNRYIVEREPWTLFKEGKKEPLEATLYHCLEVLRIAGLALLPVMPERIEGLLKQIGASSVPAPWDESMKWGGLKPGDKVPGGDPLFPRIGKLLGMPPEAAAREAAAVEAAGAAKQKKEKQKKPAKDAPTEDGVISIDDFFKTQLRVAEVLEAKEHPNADKLLVLQIAIGEERRQLVAGLAAYYKPEELVGKRLVVVANLQPAKLRGELSQGMLLAAKKGDRLSLVTVEDGDFPSGGEVS